MSQSTVPQAATTCLNPHTHHIHVAGSQHWHWIARTRTPRILSPEATKRYRWVRWHATYGQNVSRTCRHHAISRRTFYRWHHRFERQGVAGLEDRSHRPHHCPRPTWIGTQVQVVLALREEYPAWGAAKPAILLRRQGQDLPVSMVGRILRHPKATGQVRKAPRRRRATVKFSNHGATPIRTWHNPRPHDAAAAQVLALA